jgi:hypothetical protein
MRYIILLSFVSIIFSGCIYKQETINSRGQVTEEKYIIKRPVKDFVEKVEFE